jgi:DNA-binding NtrC family response regulator
MRILEAAGGNQAIEVASHYGGIIDVLLTDVIMPGGFSGPELAEYLTASRPEMKVLLMSGNCPEGLTIKPTWRFLPKPFRPSDLLGHVDSMCDGHAMRGTEKGKVAQK